MALAQRALLRQNRSTTSSTGGALPAVRGRRPRILVLEDNCMMADSLCELIRNSGYDAAGAVGRIDTAFEFLEQREIDGAIVDINLHGDMSFPVCHELQRR